MPAPVPSPDLIDGVVALLREEFPGISRDRALAFEFLLRARYGGQRRYITRHGGVERPQAHAARAGDAEVAAAPTKRLQRA